MADIMFKVPFDKLKEMMDKVLAAGGQPDAIYISKDGQYVYAVESEKIPIYDSISLAAQEIDRLKNELAESQAKCDHADELLAQSLRIEEKVRKELEESQAVCAAYRQALEKVNQWVGLDGDGITDPLRLEIKEVFKSDAGKEWIEAVREARNEIQNNIPVEKRDCVLYDQLNRLLGELAE